MRTLLNFIQTLMVEEDAATSVEYAVMLMLIIGVCLAVIQTLGADLNTLWGDNVSELNDAYDAAN